MLNINELIIALNGIKKEYGNLNVCKVGHYGEIHHLSLSDIEPIVAAGGVFGEGTRKMVVNIDTPDVGPEPD